MQEKVPQKKMSLQQKGQNIQQAQSSTSSAKPEDISTHDKFEIPSNLPGGLKTLVKSLRRKAPQTFTIEIPIIKDVFGTAGQLYVSYEDIMHMAKFKDIGATCIAVYMR